MCCVYKSRLFSLDEGSRSVLKFPLRQTHVHMYSSDIYTRTSTGAHVCTQLTPSLSLTLVRSTSPRSMTPVSKSVTACLLSSDDP